MYEGNLPGRFHEMEAEMHAGMVDFVASARLLSRDFLKPWGRGIYALERPGIRSDPNHPLGGRSSRP